MKIKGGKPGTSALVYSVQDILNKRDFKKTGRPVSTSKPSAPAFVRTSSGERTIAPPVPQFRGAQTEVLPQPSSPRAESSMVGASSKVSDPSLGLPGSPQPSLIGALNPSNLQEHLKHHGDDTQKASPGYCGASPQASSPPQSPEASREDAANHVGSTVEELPPTHLGPETKWDWKARHRQYEAALFDPKKVGPCTENVRNLRQGRSTGWQSLGCLRSARSFRIPPQVRKLTIRWLEEQSLCNAQERCKRYRTQT